MPNKVLFVSHLANFQKFNRSLIDCFKKDGWRVDYASSGEEEIQGCDAAYQVHIARSPLHPGNVKAIFALRKILRDNKYDLIHCHTPMGSVVARLANLFAGKSRTKIIYTAHGFHFYKGAPLLNWMLFYPIEKLLARVTDAIITINQEDYDLAIKKFRTKVYVIDGVGVNLKRFVPVSHDEKIALRKKYNYGPDEFIVIYVAEVIKRKNHHMIVRNMDKMTSRIPRLKFIFAGEATDSKIARHFADYPNIDFVGYRRDVDVLFQIADVSMSTSRQEGLAINVVEAMASGLPVVCSDVRGNSDAVEDGVNGYVFNLSDDEEMVEKLEMVYKDKKARRRFSENNLEKVKQYSQDIAVANTFKIYHEVLNEK